MGSCGGCWELWQKWDLISTVPKGSRSGIPRPPAALLLLLMVDNVELVAICSSHGNSIDLHETRPRNRSAFLSAPLG